MAKKRLFDKADPLPIAERSLLTLKELAAYLNVNERTILRLAGDRELPAVKIGNQWRFRKDVIDAWLDDQMLGVARSSERLPVVREHGPRAFNLEDCFHSNYILEALQATNDMGVLLELSVHAYQLGLVRDRIWFAGALAERENVLSSAVGKGLAFPHTTARHPEQVARPFVLLGRSRTGIDFHAPDELPVHFFFLLGLRHQEQHIPWLARLSSVMSNPELFDAMLDALDADALFDLVRGAERGAK